MSDFICKKCGSTEYEIKDKPNGTGIAHGLYCAKCGFWHKWLGKEELKQYATKESKDDIIAKLQSENAALRERLDKAVELPCKVGDKVYCIHGMSNPEMLEWQVNEIRITDHNYMLQLGHAGTKDYRNEASQFYGKWWFTTREAALARLAELKGREGMNKTIIEDTMWTFLAMGGQKGNPEVLNDYVQKLLRMTKQKNAGQKGYAKKDDISFDLIDPTKWSIICEAVALCLDERFPKIVELFKGEEKE